MLLNSSDVLEYFWYHLHASGNTENIFQHRQKKTCTYVYRSRYIGSSSPQSSPYHSPVPLRLHSGLSPRATEHECDSIMRECVQISSSSQNSNQEDGILDSPTPAEVLQRWRTFMIVCCDWLRHIMRKYGLLPPGLSIKTVALALQRGRASPVLDRTRLLKLQSTCCSLVLHRFLRFSSPLGLSLWRVPLKSVKARRSQTYLTSFSLPRMPFCPISVSILLLVDPFWTLLLICIQRLWHRTARLLTRLSHPWSRNLLAPLIRLTLSSHSAPLVSSSALTRLSQLPVLSLVLLRYIYSLLGGNMKNSLTKLGDIIGRLDGSRPSPCWCCSRRPGFERSPHQCWRCAPRTPDLGWNCPRWGSDARRGLVCLY